MILTFGVQRLKASICDLILQVKELFFTDGGSNSRLFLGTTQVLATIILFCRIVTSERCVLGLNGEHYHRGTNYVTAFYSGDSSRLEWPTILLLGDIVHQVLYRQRQVLNNYKRQRSKYKQLLRCNSDANLKENIVIMLFYGTT